MWQSYTRHNVQNPRLSITKSHDEGTFVLFSLQTLRLQLYTEAVTRLMEWYRDNLWAKDRLGAINLAVRICLHHTPINTLKDYHASTFMIIRIKHNPTIWALFQLNLISRAQWSLVKIKTALRIMINIGRCHQTSRWSLIITANIVPSFRYFTEFSVHLELVWSQLQSGMQKRSDQLRSQKIILFSLPSIPRDYVTYGSVLLKTKASVQRAK